MARAPKTPKIGHNGGLPDHADLRAAAAMEMIFEEQEKELREKKKRARLRLVEGKGIQQDDMKFLKSLRDKAGSEVIDLFRRQWHSVGAFYPDAHDQMDLFTKKSDAPTRAAYFTMGLVAGLQGKDLDVPAAIVGDDRQQMIAGHNEGRERRANAWKEMAEAEGGTVVDGTGTKPSKGAAAAAAVNDQAGKDFAADQGGDPLVVNGIRYANMRQANAARVRLQAATGEAPAGDQAGSPAGDQDDKPLWADFPDDVHQWSGSQRDAFRHWYEAQPKEIALDPADIEHVGAAAELTRLQEGSKPEQATFLGDPEPRVGDDAPAPILPLKSRAPLARPDFQAWDENWQKWTGPQEMEFRRWVESVLDAGQPVAVTHAGGNDYIQLIIEERKNKALTDAREADEAAFEAAAPTLPDPAEVEAGVKKLEESGFTASAKKSRRRSAPVGA